MHFRPVTALLTFGYEGERNVRRKVVVHTYVKGVFFCLEYYGPPVSVYRLGEAKSECHSEHMSQVAVNER